MTELDLEAAREADQRARDAIADLNRNWGDRYAEPRATPSILLAVPWLGRLIVEVEVLRNALRAASENVTILEGIRDRKNTEIRELVETVNRLALERDAFRDERNEARDEAGRLRAWVGLNDRVGEREAVQVDEIARLNSERDRLAVFVAWLVSLDDVDGPGVEERRRVTLTAIIDRARRALDGEDTDG